jgi:hypothetical protein
MAVVARVVGRPTVAARETHVDVPTEIQRAAALDGVEHCPFAEGERMNGLVS